MVYQSVRKQFLAEARFTEINPSELDVYFDEVSKQLKKEYVEVKGDQLLGAAEYIVWVRYFQTPFPGEIVKLPVSGLVKLKMEPCPTTYLLVTKLSPSTPRARMDEHLNREFVAPRGRRRSDLHGSWVHDKYDYTEQQLRVDQRSRVDIDSYGSYRSSHRHRSSSRLLHEEQFEKLREARSRSASPRGERIRSSRDGRDCRHRDSRRDSSRHRHNARRENKEVASSREARRSLTYSSAFENSTENKQSKLLTEKSGDQRLKEAFLSTAGSSHIAFGSGNLFSARAQEEFMEEKAMRSGCRGAFFCALNATRQEIKQEHKNCSKEIRHYLSNSIVWEEIFKGERYPGVPPSSGHSKDCMTRSANAIASRVRRVVTEKYSVPKFSTSSSVLPPPKTQAIVQASSLMSIDAQSTGIPNLPLKTSSVAGIENIPPRNSRPPVGSSLAAASDSKSTLNKNSGFRQLALDIRKPPLGAPLGPRAMGFPNHTLKATLINASGAQANVGVAKVTKAANEAIPINPERLKLQQREAAEPTRTRKSPELFNLTPQNNTYASMHNANAIPLGTPALTVQMSDSRKGLVSGSFLRAPPEDGPTSGRGTQPSSTVLASEPRATSQGDSVISQNALLAIKHPSKTSSSGTQSHNQQIDLSKFLIVHGKLTRWSEKEMMRIAYSWMMDPRHNAVERDLACQLQANKRKVDSGLRFSAVPFTKGDEKAGERGAQVLRAWVDKASQHNVFLSDFWTTEKHNFPLPASPASLATVTTLQALEFPVEPTKSLKIPTVAKSRSPKGQMEAVASPAFSKTTIIGQSSTSRAPTEEGSYESDYAEIILESPSKLKRKAGNEQFEVSIMDQGSIEKRQKRFN